LWYAAEALQRRLIAILETDVDPEDRNLTLIPTARGGLKPILIAINEPASEDPGGPSRLDPVISTYKLPTKLEIAEIQFDNDPQSALATIEETAPLVEKTRDEVIRLKFYRIKGDTLLKLQRLAEAEATYMDGLDIAEKAFGLLLDQEKRLSWMKETGEIYCGMIGVLLEQGRNEQALQLWEWYLSHRWDSEGHKSLAGRISWPEIENEVRVTSVPASGTRLVYALIKGRIYLWAIRNGNLRLLLTTEITREQLRQQINSFANEIANENSNILNLEEDSQRLFAQMLEPIAADLPPAGTVTIELDPAMDGLVVEALKSPRGWYLGQKYAVVYSPGLIEERQLRPLAGWARGRGWLLNALTVNDKDIHPPPGIEVVNAYNFDPAKFHGLLGDTELFFFLGHGEPGGLRMPNGAPLRPEDFTLQSLQKLQVAGLFACSSGTTRKGLSDTSNLVHKLLSGGVPAIIASQWDVSRSRTTDLIASFDGHLQGGDSPADAMLAARRKIFQASPHPYYWAAFTLTGRAD
jgi:CHAT domain-containing protein